MISSMSTARSSAAIETAKISSRHPNVLGFATHDALAAANIRSAAETEPPLATVLSFQVLALFLVLVYNINKAPGVNLYKAITDG